MISRFLAVATQVMVMSIVVSVLLLFVGISILVILHICVVGRAVGTGLRGVVAGAGVGEVARGGDEDMGLSSKDLEALPCYDFEGSHKGNCNEGSVDCAVCLECLEVGDRCRLLPICGHSFHKLCIDSWLRKSSICPVCRTNALLGNSTQGQFEEIHSRFVEVGGHQSVSVLPPPSAVSAT